MKVIGISGKAGSGKDTTYLVIEELLREQGLKATKLSFAGKLKDVCSLLFGWDRDRLESDPVYKEGGLGLNGPDDIVDPACELLGKTRRQVMQEVGTEAMRNGLHPDVWIIALRLAILNGEYEGVDVGVLTDCRFTNEFEFIYEMNGTTILVERVGEKETLTTRTQHESELQWTTRTDWDFKIKNEVSEKNLEESRLKLRSKLHNEILPKIIPEYRAIPEREIEADLAYFESKLFEAKLAAAIIHPVQQSPTR